MTNLKTNLAYTAAACLIAIGACQQKEKIYSVNHSRNEWGAKQQGLYSIQRISRYSCLPPDVRYFIDSVCDSQTDDIQKQVSAGIAADTVKVKK